MAIKNLRKQRKNSKGEYDVLHYETNAAQVIMENGKTLQDMVSSDGMASTILCKLNVSTQWIQADGCYWQSIDQDIADEKKLRATDVPIPGVAYGIDNDANIIYEECFDKILRIEAYEGGVNVWAREKIHSAFPILLQVVR